MDIPVCPEYKGAIVVPADANIVPMRCPRGCEEIGRSVDKFTLYVNRKYQGGILYADLMEWAEDELELGSRVIAGKVTRVAERVKKRYEEAQRTGAAAIAKRAY